jgi:hypothetical protein
MGGESRYTAPREAERGDFRRRKKKAPDLTIGGFHNSSSKLAHQLWYVPGAGFVSLN